MASANEDVRLQEISHHSASINTATLPTDCLQGHEPGAGGR